MNPDHPTKIILISEDGIKFPVNPEVLKAIGIFRNLIDLSPTAAASPVTPISTLNVPNVNSLILDKVVQYLENWVKGGAAIGKMKKRTREVMVSSAGASSGLTMNTSSGNGNNSNNNSNNNNNNDDDDEEDQEDKYNDNSNNEGNIDMISDSSEDELAFAEEDNLRIFTPFEQEFFATLDIPNLIELTKAANYLYIPVLLDACCKAIAGHMKGLSVEELRGKFNIRNDFTAEEEERVRRETAWIDD